MDACACCGELEAPGFAPAAKEQAQHERFFARTATQDLKRKSVHGGTIVLGSQAVKFALRTGSMMLLARLLTPEDFGLQGMVAAMTGFLGLFRDAGLSTVTVQREVITHQQVSTLFWINVAVGVALASALAAVSPLVAMFYKQPCLCQVAMVSASAFLFNGLGVQHLALLQRQMRFVALGIIEACSLALSAGVAVWMAAAGCGYWALVAMVIAGPLVSAVGAWVAVPWLPGWPKRGCGARDMLRFGGVLTLNGVVMYVAYNIEKVLLGRYWGAQTLGLYGRAYQLITLPSEQLNGAISTVAFPSLSHLQNDPPRLAKAFLRGYSVVLSLTIPITICCAVFGREIFLLVLGPKWVEAVPVFRLLSPTVLVFALINPWGWFLISSGRFQRNLYLAFLIAPCVILGVALGIHFGPVGVALGFSGVMSLLVVPVTVWAKAGSGISARAAWEAVRGPLVSGVAAALMGLAAECFLATRLPFVVTLILGSGLVFCTHFLMLFYAVGQKQFYLDLIRQFSRSRKDKLSQAD